MTAFVAESKALTRNNVLHMSNLTPAEDRQLAYFGKFGTKHPSDSAVLAWALEIFPGRSLKFRRGLFKCQINQGGKTITRHLKRVGLMQGSTVLGVGTDAVEAVAAADIQNKRNLAARAAEQTKNEEPKSK